LDQIKLLKGWVFNFQGSQESNKWSDSHQLVYRGKRKEVAVPCSGGHQHPSQETALKAALKAAEAWLEQHGLEQMMGLGKEVQIKLHLKDYPEAYNRLPFAKQDLNLGDPVRNLHTDEEGTISDAVYAGKDEGHYKITYEVNRGDGLFFWVEASSLARLQGIQSTA